MTAGDQPLEEDDDVAEASPTTGSKFAKRNAIAANDFTIARSIWNMHDALLIEQRRTNQLLEWIGGILQQGGQQQGNSGRE